MNACTTFNLRHPGHRTAHHPSRLITYHDSPKPRPVVSVNPARGLGELEYLQRHYKDGDSADPGRTRQERSEETRQNIESPVCCEQEAILEQNQNENLAERRRQRTPTWGKNTSRHNHRHDSVLQLRARCDFQHEGRHGRHSERIGCLLHHDALPTM